MNPFALIFLILIAMMMLVKCDANNAAPAALYTPLVPLVVGGGSLCGPPRS